MSSSLGRGRQQRSSQEETEAGKQECFIDKSFCETEVGLLNWSGLYYLTILHCVPWTVLNDLVTCRCSSNLAETQQQKKAKKDFQHPELSEDAAKKSKLHKNQAKTQESSKKTEKNKVSHKPKKSNGKCTEHPQSETVIIQKLLPAFFSFNQ